MRPGVIRSRRLERERLSVSLGRGLATQLLEREHYGGQVLLSTAGAIEPKCARSLRALVRRSAMGHCR